MLVKWGSLSTRGEEENVSVIQIGVSGISICRCAVGIILFLWHQLRTFRLEHHLHEPLYRKFQSDVWQWKHEYCYIHWLG